MGSKGPKRPVAISQSPLEVSPGFLPSVLGSLSSDSFAMAQDFFLVVGIWSRDRALAQLRCWSSSIAQVLALRS